MKSCQEDLQPVIMMISSLKPLVRRLRNSRLKSVSSRTRTKFSGVRKSLLDVTSLTDTDEIKKLEKMESLKNEFDDMKAMYDEAVQAREYFENQLKVLSEL